MGREYCSYDVQKTDGIRYETGIENGAEELSEELQLSIDMREWKDLVD